MRTIGGSHGSWWIAPLGPLLLTILLPCAELTDEGAGQPGSRNSQEVGDAWAPPNLKFVLLLFFIGKRPAEVSQSQCWDISCWLRCRWLGPFGTRSVSGKETWHFLHTAVTVLSLLQQLSCSWTCKVYPEKTTAGCSSWCRDNKTIYSEMWKAHIYYVHPPGAWNTHTVGNLMGSLIQGVQCFPSIMSRQAQVLHDSAQVMLMLHVHVFSTFLACSGLESCSCPFCHSYHSVLFPV